jgi:hypothetical protein
MLANALLAHFLQGRVNDVVDSLLLKMQSKTMQQSHRWRRLTLLLARHMFATDSNQRQMVTLN